MAWLRLSNRLIIRLLVILALILAGERGFAADRFLGFNETTSAVFTGVYLAPSGSGSWGANQALNDKDKRWDFGERLAITGLSPGMFDLKIIDLTGRTCIRHRVDLTRDRTFEVRDDDLRECTPGKPR